MVKYLNLMTGRVLERPASDRWLEASPGWELIDEPPSEPVTDDDNERMD